MEKIGGIDAAAVRKMAGKPSVVAMFTLVTALLPWIITFTPPLLRSLQVGFATDAWSFMVGWLTTPVLFVLVNFVILSIWATSGGAPLGREGDGASQRADEAGRVIKSAAAMARGKETVLVLPPVVSVIPDLQRSVFSTEAGNKILKNNEDGVSRKRSLESAAESERELKISPPPPPSFLVEQRDKEKFKISASGRARPKPKQMDRRNSDPGRRNKGESVASKAPLKINSEKRVSSAPPPSVVIKDISFGDVADHSPRLGRRDPMVVDKDELNERVEAFVANFYEQLRLQRHESLRTRKPEDLGEG